MIGRLTRVIPLAAAGALMPILAGAQEALSTGELQIIEMDNPFGSAPIVRAVGLFAIIIAAMYFASQREKRRQEFLARFVEKEKAIPRQLLPPQPSRERELRRGGWLLSLGLSFGLVLYIVTEDWVNAAWSLILLFLAAASFINAALFYPSADARRQLDNGE